MQSSNKFQLFRINSTPFSTLTLLLLSLVLAGCQSLDNNSGNRRVNTAARANVGNTLSDGSIRHDTDSPRIAQLWAAAEKAKSERKWNDAERYIQEALQLQPKDGVLWSRAADLKLTLLEPALAERFAMRSVAFANDNRTLLHRNWLIIEHAREMQGDMLGVREAHKQVQSYQY